MKVREVVTSTPVFLADQVTYAWADGVSTCLLLLNVRSSLCHSLLAIRSSTIDLTKCSVTLCNSSRVHSLAFFCFQPLLVYGSASFYPMIKARLLPVGLGVGWEGVDQSADPWKGSVSESRLSNPTAGLWGFMLSPPMCELVECMSHLGFKSRIWCVATGSWKSFLNLDTNSAVNIMIWIWIDSSVCREKYRDKYHHSLANILLESSGQRSTLLLRRGRVKIRNHDYQMECGFGSPIFSWIPLMEQDIRSKLDTMMQENTLIRNKARQLHEDLDDTTLALKIKVGELNTLEDRLAEKREDNAELTRQLVAAKEEAAKALLRTRGEEVAQLRLCLAC